MKLVSGDILKNIVATVLGGLVLYAVITLIERPSASSGDLISVYDELRESCEPDQDLRRISQSDNCRMYVSTVELFNLGADVDDFGIVFPDFDVDRKNVEVEISTRNADIPDSKAIEAAKNAPQFRISVRNLKEGGNIKLLFRSPEPLSIGYFSLRADPDDVRITDIGLAHIYYDRKINWAVLIPTLFMFVYLVAFLVPLAFKVARLRRD